MKADTPLDYALFQLDPSRSRCELWISAGVKTEKLATGSFKPFLSHLRVAQEQNAKGASSVRLQVPSAGRSNTTALWFSKGTLQRFVRFVSTPEILERLRLLDDEFRQLEEAISILAANSFRDNDQVADLSSEQVSLSGQNAAISLNPDYPNNSVCSSDGFKGLEHTNGTSKKPLLRVMDSCQFMLLNELQKTHTQAVAAGFDEESMPEMLIFADTFGATRLRDACLNFTALSKKRKLYLSSTLSQNESTGTADSDAGIALNSEHANLKYPENEHITIDACNEEPLFKEHAHNSDLAHLKMRGRNSTIAIPPRAFYQPGLAISQPPYVSMNSHKHSSQVDNWGDDNNGNLKIEEIVETLNIKRHPSEVVADSTTIPSAFSGSLLVRTVSTATAGATRSLSQFSQPEHWQTEENLSKQNPSPENELLADKELSGPTDSVTSRPLVRRSTSPRRRSSSPLRKVHISRSPARRPIVVVKNVAYSSPGSHDHSTVLHKHQHPARTSEDMSTEDSTDSITESEEECNIQKTRNRRLSVQAAISLFENSQKDSFSVKKKKFGQHDASRRCAESAKTVSSGKSVLRRWSGANDASIKNGQLSSNLCSVNDLNLAEEKVLVKNQKKKTEEKGEKVGKSTCHQSEGFLQPRGIELLKQLRYESSVQLIARDMCIPQMQTVINSPRCNLKSSECSDAVLGLPEQETQNGRRWSKAVTLEQPDVSVKKQNSEVPLISCLQSADNNPTEHRIAETFESKVVVDYDKNLVVEQNYLQGGDLAPTETSTLFPDKDVITSNTVELTKQAVFQTPTGEQESSLDWKTSIDLQPEMQSYQLVSGVKGSEERNQGLITDDSFIMSELHTGKGSLSRSWSIASHYGMLSLLDVADSKLSQNSTEVPTKENDSPGDDQKGRLYKQYREKRDAKFREESGTRRAEREAKLKAMQEVLERRKAELAERNVRQYVDKQSQSEGQCHREKTFLSRTSLRNVNKEKELESRETPCWEDHKQPQRVRVALGSQTTGMIMQSAASTPKSMRQQISNPRPSVVRKLSPSSQKSFTTSTSTTPRTARSLALSSPNSVTKNSTITTPTGQHRSSNRSEPCAFNKTLYRSVPSYPEPRKENTKPLSVKSGPLTQQDKVLSSRGTKPKVSTSSFRHKQNSVLPLESMSSNSSLQEEKKYEALATRKSVSTVSELKVMQGSSKEENILSPLKVLIRDLAEPSPQSKAYKASMASTVVNEVKPFLRKGRGIGPGAGRGVLKLKASLAAEATKANDDDLSSKMDGNGSDGPETLVSSTSFKNVPSTDSEADQNKPEMVTVTVIKNEEEATSEVEKSVVHAPLLAFIPETEPSQQSSNAAENFQKEKNASDEICKIIALSECQHFTLDPSLASHSVVQQEESQSFEGPAATLQQEPLEDPSLASQSVVQQEESQPFKGPAAALQQEPLEDPSIASHSVVQQEESQPFKGPAAALQQEPSEDSKIINSSCPLGLSLPSPRFTLQQHMSISKNYAILASASDISLSHKLSPEHHIRRLSGGSSSPRVSPASRGFPQLRYSLSPNIDSAKAEAVQSRKRWGNTYKLSVTNTQPASKEAPRGFKRLLKFGRRSRSSANSNTEWISASTTSGEDDVDEAKDLTSKSSEDTVRTTASSLSNLRKTADNVSRISETECLTGAATRSFFSLSAFRKQRP